jgi:hypothetical protein
MRIVTPSVEELVAAFEGNSFEARPKGHHALRIVRAYSDEISHGPLVFSVQLPFIDPHPIQPSEPCVFVYFSNEARIPSCNFMVCSLEAKCGGEVDIGRVMVPALLKGLFVLGVDITRLERNFRVTLTGHEKLVALAAFREKGFGGKSDGCTY